MGRFDKLPGIDDENTTRRNVLIGGGYTVAGLAVVGAALPDSEGDSSPAPDAGSDDDTHAGGDSSDEGDGAESEPEQEPESEPEPAFFEITASPLPTAAVSEDVSVDVAIENTGGQEATQEITVSISDETVATESVTVAAGDQTSIMPTVMAPEAAGEYDVTVASEDDEVTLTLTVNDPGPEPQQFNGTGQEVRSGVQIDGGLTVVEATHDGNSNFQVSLEGDGEFGTLFINVIGSFDGAQAALVTGGEYILDVTADGSWEIELRQPRASSGDALPVDASGSGPDVIGPFAFDGTGIATGSHDGQSNFQVQIYPATGTFGELVFNEIGSIDAETTYNFDGLGWVDVNADGNWSVSLE